MSIKNLVLAGALAKGFSYLGVYKSLLETGLINDVENICAVSSGSIAALFICLELNYDQCSEIIYKIFKYDNLKTFKSEDIFNIPVSYGLETGKNIIKLLGLLLEKKTGNRECTFLDLKKKFPKRNLIIGVTNITNGKYEYFSEKHTPNMKICDAIRMTISIPFIFTAPEYKNSLYGDGAIINNFPLEYFDDDLENTIGCCASNLSDYSDINSFISYISRLFDVICNVQQNTIMKKYKKNIINIILPDISLLDSLSKIECKDVYINNGYNQFNKNIKKLPIYSSIEYRFIIKDILNEILDSL